MFGCPASKTNDDRDAYLPCAHLSLRCSLGFCLQQYFHFRSPWPTSFKVLQFFDQFVEVKQMKKMLSVLCLVLLAGCVYGHEGHQAVVVLQGKGVEGYVVFTHEGDLVRGEGKVTGLKPGKHGFHVHASGDLREGCASTLGHFNPFNKHHGAPEDDERHVGDLGNIFADSEGVAIVKIEDKLISLHGDLSIIGRAVVVHEGEDDLGRGNTKDSLTTGNAGGRVACGIIGTL